MSARSHFVNKPFTFGLIAGRAPDAEVTLRQKSF